MVSMMLVLWTLEEPFSPTFLSFPCCMVTGQYIDDQHHEDHQERGDVTLGRGEEPQEQRHYRGDGLQKNSEEDAGGLNKDP